MTTPETVHIGSLALVRGGPLFVVAGPCVIESRETTLQTAEFLADYAGRHDVPLVFKCSFDKANRTSRDSYRGPGLQEGLAILEEAGRVSGLTVTTDIHLPEQAEAAAAVCGMLQIPAFLCRQTDLLEAAAATGKPVNIKKAQFMAPWDMRHAVAKVRQAGAGGVLLTERGSSFGYNRLVSDMTALPVMRELAPLVVFDATHSVQLPSAGDGRSGGQREMVPHLARAAVACGCDGLFLEVHPEPDTALSDGPNMLPLAQVAVLLDRCREIHDLVRGSNEST